MSEFFWATVTNTTPAQVTPDGGGVKQLAIDIQTNGLTFTLHDRIVCVMVGRKLMAVANATSP